MNEKKIEPTDAMVDAVEFAREFVALDARTIMRAALNHPDAPGLFKDEDDRPWEPLNGRRPRVGEEIRRDRYGITSIALVGRVDRNGDPWTSDGALIGMLSHGTWYVRRPAIQELPTKRRTVIVAADGHEYIEAVVSGVIWRTSEAILGLDGRWHGVWRAGSVAVGSTSADSITPGTWKVEGE